MKQTALKGNGDLEKNPLKGKEPLEKTVYFGGDIITMEPDGSPQHGKSPDGQPYGGLPHDGQSQSRQPQAVLVEDGIIRYVGTKKEAVRLAGGGASMVDLVGAALLPAFIDSHSHITAFANTLGLVDLTGAKNFEDMIQKLRAFANARKLATDEWVVGFGYDHNFLMEKQHPDKSVLDRAVPDHPVLITHASGHMGVVNSAGLLRFGIGKETEEPAGGRIGRLGDGSPDGYLEETAFTAYSARIPQPDRERLCRQMELAQQQYLQYGITTVQDGLTRENDLPLLMDMAREHRLLVDTVSYIDLNRNGELLVQNQRYLKNYQNRLKIGGYKIFLDGSPQGRTAWMSRPYQNGIGNGSDKDGYCGYPIYEDEQVESFLKTAVAKRVQILAHCNGDAAAEQLIRCYERVIEKQAPIRPVMIHAQLVRPDQLKRMAALGMVASFFTAHTYYWGDIHRQNFGKERADTISPARSAQEAGVVYTLHQDTPVIRPDMMQTVWCAVNRISKSSRAMGTEERITPYEALQAVTIHAAYQYFEEGQKGSIQPGKLADLVVLERNPLTADPMELDKISVLQTIKEGRVLYQR